VVAIPREAYMVSVNCNFCGVPFLAKSRKARFHSAACKQKYYRWHKKLPAAADKAAALLDEIGLYLDYPASRAAALEALRQLQSKVLEQPQKRDIRFVR